MTCASPLNVDKTYYSETKSAGVGLGMAQSAVRRKRQQGVGLSHQIIDSAGLKLTDADTEVQLLPN